MKKGKLLLTILLSSTLLASCNTTQTNSSENNGDSSSEVVEKQYNKDESIVSIENLDLSLYEMYNLNYMINETFSKDHTIEIISENETVVSGTEDHMLFSSDLGTSKVKVVIDDTYYDELTVNVKDEEYMSKNFTTDLARLSNKSFLVLGDSISDVSVTAYPDNRPDFWCEQLVRKGNMKMYNHAVSGSTAGYCKQQVDSMAWTNDITGTSVVRKVGVRDDAAKCQYAFIYFGNNDITFGTEIGKCGEIDDTNYYSKESFKGAYSDIISKLRKYNPAIRIVCLSLSPSTWGRGPIDSSKHQASSRAELSNVVKEIADEMNCKYIDVHSIWQESSVSDMQKYATDGIHPTTAGYDLIVEKILNS